MTGQPTGHGPDNGEPVDVLTAAERLGITPDAVRKRLTRGQLLGVKRDGRWYALLSARPDTDRTDTPSDRTRLTGHGPDSGPPDRTEELLAQLRSEVSFLREENRRKDTIIAALVEGQRRLSGPDRTDTTVIMPSAPRRRMPVQGWRARVARWLGG